MNKPLRSLSGLIDFDCAARWGSFKLAAQELHKTPAAISLQVKQLEENVGFALFVRHPRHITLTEKGEELAAVVRRMLSELRTRIAALQDSDDEKVLRITTTHSLAQKWLVPRIPRFTKQNPDIDIRVYSGDQLVNLEDESIDLAIRTLNISADDPHLLFHERLVAVYSPALLPPGRAALTLEDLQRVPLLYEETNESWIKLLRENDALKGQYNFARSYSNFAVMAQAALAGQGVGLLSYSIAYEDIRNGALMMVDCRSAPYERGYRLVVARGKEGMSKIACFSAWLKEEIAEMQRTLD